MYLDEVSLRSLLVSQKDTIPEQVSRAISQAEEAEIAGKVSSDALVAKGEVSSRFQTSNSNSVQSSRKAIVQTLFKELRDDVDLDYSLVVRSDPPEQFADIASVARELDPSVVASAASFQRGALVEIEVELEVDPVFKLGTLFSEYTSMAEEYPELFGTARAAMQDAQPVNKILQRLLAGLIPIRARAINLSVVQVGGVEYVVHNDAISGLDVDRRPLEVVGVTEHIGYWKDIRRVLFSSARVTMLCRVARDGLHASWTPVKLADVFRDVVPTLVDQINEASRTGMGSLALARPQDRQQEALGEALNLYKRKLAGTAGIELGVVEEAEIALAVRAAEIDVSSLSGQRRAFAAVRGVIEGKAGDTILDPDGDLVARREARAAAGLPLFPRLEDMTNSNSPQQPNSTPREDDRLLDVEVVAIYW